MKVEYEREHQDGSTEQFEIENVNAIYPMAADEHFEYDTEDEDSAQGIEPQSDAETVRINRIVDE